MSEPLKIEKGVPVPAKCAYLTKYPFTEMEVGDSFFVQTDKPNNVRISILGSARAGRHKGKFITRKMDGGIRCWRIK